MIARIHSKIIAVYSIFNIFLTCITLKMVFGLVGCAPLYS